MFLWNKLITKIILIIFILFSVNMKSNKKELLSDMALMKLRPQKGSIFTRPKEQQLCVTPQLHRMMSKQKQQSKLITSKQPRKIKFLQMAGEGVMLVGNQHQIDLIGIDGMVHDFIDTFYFWSLSLSPIDHIEMNQKRQIFILVSGKNIRIYEYGLIKGKSKEPILNQEFTVEDPVFSVQFFFNDMIVLFFKKKMEAFFLDDQNMIIERKHLSQKYPLEGYKNFKLLSIPANFEQKLNIFFEEKIEEKSTFGLWCMQVNILSESIRMIQPFKIYDIKNNLRNVMKLQNFSKDTIIINLGKELFAARKGYIIDSVSIDIQHDDSFLKIFNQRQILLHVEKNKMDIFSFQINTSINPNKIQLKNIDSVQIRPTKGYDMKLLDIVSHNEHNFALFYEIFTKKVMANGEFMYSFCTSYSVDKKVKIAKMLQSKLSLENITQEKIEQKCDILRSIGLSNKQVYYEIWKRTNKSSIKDYQFLLGTKDYSIIKGQIEERLRHHSMSFKDVFKVEESCLDILKKAVFSEQCNEESLKNYLISHLFYKKLALFRELEFNKRKINFAKRSKMLSIEEKSIQGDYENQGILYINIHDYYYYKNTDIKKFILERVSDFKNYQEEKYILEIRVIIRHFKFIYRYIYKQLLEEIINISGSDIYRLLQQIPQLLPFDQVSPSLLEIQISAQSDDNLYQGIWGQIKQKQWDENLYLDSIINVNNKQKVQEFIENIWFKRNILGNHILIRKNKEEIMQISEQNNSSDIFYLVIEKIIQKIENEELLTEIFCYLQKNYSSFPKHLKGLINLYRKLYKTHLQFTGEKCKQYKMRNFLQLKDCELFKEFFEYEKIKKNSFLKQIKPIYIQYPNGRQVFNQSLFSHFRSQISQISNLKYLLNRINNQKRQFHVQHVRMYEILIKAVQIKLRLGGQQDIPIEQLLIYLENIPIAPQNTEMIYDLEMIQKVAEEEELLKSLKLDMSIEEIINKPQFIFEKIIEMELQKNMVFTIDCSKKIMSITLKILAHLESINDNIYNCDNELLLFIYLCKLLEKKHMIGFVSEILVNDHLNNYFMMNQEFCQSLVEFMYKWKFSQSALFWNNESYFAQLLQIIPQDSNIRMFIENQIYFANIFTTQKTPIRYPLTHVSRYPGYQQLKEFLKNYPTNKTLSLNIEQIFKVMANLQENSSYLSKQESLILEEDKIQLEKVHHIFIYDYIRKNLIKEVIPLIKKDIQQFGHAHSSLSILMMLEKIIYELNDDCKYLLILITSNLYSKPTQLLGYIEDIMGKKRTGLELKDQLQKKLSIVSKYNSNFVENSLLFSANFIQSEQNIENKNKLVQSTFQHMKKTKQLSVDCLFDLIYIILCNDPFHLPIFLIQINHVKIKYCRYVFSSLIKEDIFDEIKTLQFGKRLFYVLLKGTSTGHNINNLVEEMKGIDINQNYEVENIPTTKQFQSRTKKAIKVFDKKKRQLLGIEKRSHRSEKSAKYFEKKYNSLQQSLKNPGQYKKKNDQQIQDSDDDYLLQEEEMFEIKHYAFGLKPSKIKFDSQQFRNKIRKRNKKQNSPHQKKQLLEIPSEQDRLESQMTKSNKTKSKKYFSMDVRAGFDNEGPETPNPLMKKSIRKFESSDRLLASPVKFAVRQTSSQEFNQEQIPNLDLNLENKESQLEQAKKTPKNIKSDQSMKNLLKKLSKTYNQKPPKGGQYFNLSLIPKEKYAKNADFLISFINYIYQRMDRNYIMHFNLILQIARNFSIVGINNGIVDIYDRAVKYQIKYNLKLPFCEIFFLKGLYMSKQDELFEQIRQNAMKVCDDESIYKISKVIAISFKKYTYEQQVIYDYIALCVPKIRSINDEDDIKKSMEKIKGLIGKLTPKIILEKMDNLILNEVNFEMKQNLIQICIDVIKRKGDAKIAKQFSAKVK